MSSLKDAVAQVNAAAVKLSNEMSSGYQQLLKATSQGELALCPPPDWAIQPLQSIQRGARLELL